jgi:NitT/TauT family transport system permease protein
VALYTSYLEIWRTVDILRAIGYLIWTSWQVFQVDKMYVGLLATALLGFATGLLLSGLETVLIPWRRS